CLSNPKPHKNLALLVDAHAAYHDSAGTNAWPLVVSIAGPPGTDPREGAVRRAGPLADPDARALLTGAGAVVFPSLYEGFGLPPVEAAVSGVPVVVSKIPPHQEGLAELKAGEVLWVEASDRNGWIAALGAATRGELARPSLESRSKTIARFNTERMGRNMDRIYRRVLGLKA
ncbi:MAG: glycosyltransferase, partial [Oligoflexia bacterium]|nr:glycosyltransferase [Oligoflexia bacterium]